MSESSGHHVAPTSPDRGSGRADLLVGLVCLVLAFSLCAEAGEDAVAARLRLRMDMFPMPDAVEVLDRRLLAPAAVRQFYSQRGHQPAWIDAEGGRLEARELLGLLSHARDHGLNPEDYHYSLLRHGLSLLPAETNRLGLAVDLDFLFTDAAIVYALHLQRGRLRRETLQTRLPDPDQAAELLGFLLEAYAAGRLTAAFRGLSPQDPGYLRLSRHLARLNAASAPAWQLPAIAETRSWRAGMQSPWLDGLASHLGVATARGRFGPGLEEAIRALQRRNGVSPDGVIGPETRALLSRDPRHLRPRLAVNLERWRWQDTQAWARHVEVNIPAFSLSLYENGRPVARMKTIVGRPQRPTPEFSGTISYVVLNPYWNVPYKIASQDLLPDFKADPGSIERRGFELLQLERQGWQMLDPAALDWARMTPANFTYRLRQRPGPRNALGRVKFMFPNPYAVYLHDTPQQHLFERTQRSFSAGCVRVQQPQLLLAWLGDGQIPWPISTRPQEWSQRVTLARPVPVRVLYRTAWVDEAGDLQLRADVYGRDEDLMLAMQAPLLAELHWAQRQ